MELKIYTDGASKSNPGKAGIGIAIYNSNNTLIKEISKYIGIKTNNQAEYQAVLTALEFSINTLTPTKIHFFSDSQLLVKQLNGLYKVKSPKILPLYKRIKSLTQALNTKYTWIPREKNTIADQLANKKIITNKKQ